MSENLTHAQRIKNIPHDKLVELIWKNLKEIDTVGFFGAGAGKWQWVMIDSHLDLYNLTESEYFKIAKFVATSWAREEGHRVRADKLTPNHYYEVCKIMANQGVFWNFDYNKLQAAMIAGIRNPAHDIVLTVLKNCRKEDEKSIRENMLKYLKYNDIYIWALSEIGEKNKEEILKRLNRKSDEIQELIIREINGMVRL